MSISEAECLDLLWEDGGEGDGVKSLPGDSDDFGGCGSSVEVR